MPDYVTADTPVGTRVRVVSDYESCKAGCVSDGALLKHLGDKVFYDYAVEFDVPEDFMHDGARLTDNHRCYFFKYCFNSCIVLCDPIPESDYLSLLC